MNLSARFHVLARRACLALAALTLGVLAAAAPFVVAFGEHASASQPPGVTLTARAGFDGYYKDGQWVPVRVTVANDGPDLRGTLRIGVPRNYGAAETVFAREVDLPTQSRREFFLYIAPEGYVSNLRVELIEERTRRAARDLRLVQAGPGDFIYGVLAASPSAFGGLANIDPASGSAFVAQLDLGDLPPAVKGWQSLDVLVVSDVDTGALSPEQRAALAGWVAGGGRLIVSGGPAWQKTAAGLQDLLPLVPSGAQSLDDWGSLAAYSSAPAEALAGSAVVAAGTLAPEAVVLAVAQARAADARAMPLVAARRSGFGEVIYLAADPAFAPLKGWDGLEDVFRHLLARPTDRPIWAAGFHNWSPARDAVNALPTLELPSAFQICGFLFIYLIIIGPLNYLVLNRLKRRELAWVTIPGIVIFFSGVTYVTGYQLRGTQATLHQLSIVQVWPDSPQAQVEQLIGLYTPRRSSYDLEFAPGYLVRPMPQYSGYGTPASLQFEQGDKTALPDLLAEIGGVEAFVLQGQMPAPRFEANLALEVVNNLITLQGTVTNQSNLALTDAVILAPGGPNSVVRLGDLGPGETRTVSLSLPNSRAVQAATSVIAPVKGGPGPASYYPSGPSVYDTTVEDILGSSNYYSDRRLYRRYSLLTAAIDNYGGTGRGSGVYLAGWTEAAPVSARVVSHGFSTIDMTLYLVDLRPALNLGQQTLTVPPGLMTWSVIDPGQVGTPTPYGTYLNPGYGNFALRFAPMRPAAPLAFSRVRDLTLHLSGYSGSGVRTGLLIYLWDFAEGAWVLHDDLIWGDNALPTPGRFVGPDGAIQVRVDLPASAPQQVNLDVLDFTLTVER